MKFRWAIVLHTPHLHILGAPRCFHLSSKNSALAPCKTCWSVPMVILTSWRPWSTLMRLGCLDTTQVYFFFSPLLQNISQFFLFSNVSKFSLSNLPSFELFHTIQSFTRYSLNPSSLCHFCKCSMVPANQYVSMKIMQFVTCNMSVTEWHKQNNLCWFHFRESELVSPATCPHHALSGLPVFVPVHTPSLSHPGFT